MKVIAYQMSPTGIYKLAVKVNRDDYRVILVDDVHGLGDILYDTEVECIDNGDPDGLKNYIYDKFNWCEPV
jgi:hypothetical protein